MHADLLLRGGRVFSGGDPATALEVRDGRILATGSDEDLHDLAGPGTEVVDLRGRLLLPAGFLPAQALEPGTALAAYTAGSAYVNHLDDTGHLRPGYRADLVVLDRDPLAAPPEEIGAARVDLTYVDGRAVHVAPG